MNYPKGVFRADRRTFLRASGVGLALPILDAFLPKGVRAAQERIPQRLVCICTTLGLHAPFLFPESGGSALRALETRSPSTNGSLRKSD